MKVLIRGADILTADSGHEFIEQGDIVLDTVSGRIEFVGERFGGAYDEVIYAYGKLVTPGFINTHTHLAMTVFRGYGEDMELNRWLREKIWPKEAQLTDEVVYAGSILGIYEMLRTGTTSFVDMYFHEDATIEAVRHTGIRAFITPGIVESDGWEKRVEFTEELMHRELPKNVEIHTSIHGLYTCGPEVVKAVSELARKEQAFIHIHLLEAPWERKAIEERHGPNFLRRYRDEYGWFEDIRVLAAHAVWLTEEEIGLIAGKKFSVAHCPQSNLKLVSGVAPVWDYIVAGVNVSLGTDGAASNNNLDMLEEARVAAMLGKWRAGDPTSMTAKHVFEMMTIKGAQALGKDDIGVIAVGKQADLVVWDVTSGPWWYPRWHDKDGYYAHLIYSAPALSVERVFVGSREVLKNGLLTGVNVDLYALFDKLVSKFYGGGEKGDN